MIRKLSLISIPLLICLIAPFATAEALEQVVLQLKWKHQYQFAGFYAAKEMGYYREAGFNVEIRERDQAVPVFESVLDGSATFGIADSSIVIQRMLGKPVVVLAALFQHSPLVLLTRKKDDLPSPYELIGKRVMYQHGVDDAVIIAMFAELGIKSDQFTFVQHNFDDYALINQDIDAMAAYITDQVFLYQEKGFEVHAINPENYGIDFYGDLLYAHENYVKQSPERAKAFADASIRGWEYALNNHEEVIDLILRDYPTEKSRNALLYEAQTTRRMIAANLVALGTTYPARFERIAEIYRKLNFVPADAILTGLTLDNYLHSQSETNTFYIRIFFSVLVAMLVVILILWWLNQQLQQRVAIRTRSLEETNETLQGTLDEVKTLRGILPLCSFCKKIRDDEGYWEKVDVYIYKNSEADISHSICPECLEKNYPEQHEIMYSKKD